MKGLDQPSPSVTGKIIGKLHSLQFIHFLHLENVNVKEVNIFKHLY